MAQRKTAVKSTRVANSRHVETDKPRTKLGRELSVIRERMAKSGAKFLTDAQIEREIAERRGGYYDGKRK